MSKVSNFINSLFHPISPRQDALTIAGIHATALSILIGIFSTFAIYVQSNVKQMESGVPQELNKINNIPFSSQISPMEIHDIREPQKRLELISRLIHLCESSSQSEINNNAEEIYKTIYTLSKYSPFPKGWILNAQNQVVQAFMQELPPHTYIDMSSVHQWINDFDSVVKLEAYQSKISQINSTYSHFGFMRDYADSFFNNLALLKDIYSSIKYHLRQIEEYKSYLPQEAFMISTIIMAVIAFISGVIYPMFFVRVHNLFLLWIPTAFYLIVFSYIIYKLI